LTVTDDAPGVPDAFLPHVFERFSQAARGDDARSGVLGFYIVK
jgi:signal transduction histidine kinase